jgi:hypothetical protein
MYKIENKIRYKEIQTLYPIHYNMRCLGKDRHNNTCRNHALGDTRFCKFHSYMVTYTEEMIANTTLCSGCNKWYYLKDRQKTCDSCHERTKQNSVKIRENVVLCKSDGCKFKRSKENEYCMKHQICILVNEVSLRNMRLCSNYIRGCRTELGQDYKYARCAECLEKERDKDRKRRGGAIATNTNSLTNEVVTEKQCTVCCKTLPINQFQAEKGGITKTCRNCRDDNKKQDARRDKEYRNELARKNDSKPERIAVKQQWKEDNYEKVAETWQKSRNTRLETVGVEEFLKRNADDARRWRENNREKQQQINENKKVSLNLQYGVYRSSAHSKRLEFQLTLDDYQNLVTQVCYYCGIIQPRGFNGIDRLDSTKGYVLTNCVSCCQMCNMMKNTLSIDVFLRRVEHILSVNMLIENRELNPRVFENHNHISFNKYRLSALSRELDFQITEEQFHEITTQDCYLCEKRPSIIHKNGIDRFDNNIGYILENCRPCCTDCNIMKNNYEYDTLIQKLLEIYEHRVIPWKQEVSEYIKNCFPEDEKPMVAGEKLDDKLSFPLHPPPRPVSLPTNSISRVITKSNKKSKEERANEAKLRKQKQRKLIKEKFGDEEYRKLHAKQIAEQRRKKRAENIKDELKPSADS